MPNSHSHHHLSRPQSAKVCSIYQPGSWEQNHALPTPSLCVTSRSKHPIILPRSHVIPHHVLMQHKHQTPDDAGTKREKRVQLIKYHQSKLATSWAYFAQSLVPIIMKYSAKLGWQQCRNSVLSCKWLCPRVPKNSPSKQKRTESLNSIHKALASFLQPHITHRPGTAAQQQMPPQQHLFKLHFKNNIM